MNSKDRNGRIRRFACLCLTMVMILSATCIDTYASICLELPPEAETAGEPVAVTGESGEEPETAEAETAEPSDSSGEEILPEETGEPEAVSESEPAVIREGEDISALVQTQEGLEYAIAHGLVTFDTPDSGIAAISTKKGTRAEIVQIAKDQVGISGRPNKFTRWYGAIDGYPDPYAYAWCQVFASWCGYKAGVSVPRTASCYYAGEWFKDRGLWRSRSSGYTPKAGDYIYFDWSANGGWDHVGIVNYVKDGKVYTIEGNTSDMVKASKSYSLKSSEIIGYGTPKYEDGGEQNNIPKGCFDEVLPEAGTYNVRFRGWSFDWDDPSETVQIHIYVGGKAGSGAPVYGVAADFSRPDVNSAYPGCGDNHGFDVTINVPVDRTKDQKVYVYAVDSGGVENPLLGSKTLKADTSITDPPADGQADDSVPGISQGNQEEPQAPAEPVTVGTVGKPSLEQTSYNTMQLSWEAAEEADSYELECASDKKFTEPKMYAVETTRKNVRVTCGAKKYFRVRAVRTVDGAEYYGDYSETVQGKTSIGTTKLTVCKSKKKKRITISTSTVDGATSYQVVASTTKSFSSKTIAATKSGKGSFAVKKSKKYYVKTRARRKVNGSYVYGPYSNVKIVKVK